MDDRKTRIAKRWSRVEARKKKLHPKRQGAGESEADEDAKEVRISKAQVQKSRAGIMLRTERAVEAVTDVQVRVDGRERKRRRKEARKMRTTRERVAEALNAGDVANRELEEGWADIAEIPVAEDLARALQAKRTRCAALDEAKAALVSELERMLVKRDEQYTKELAVKVQDVGDITTAMKAEFNELSSRYEAELRQIEAAFVEERAALLKKCHDELDALFQVRARLEHTMLSDRQATEDEYYAELQALRLRSAEEKNNLNATLEGNIQALEQQLEEMRATYLLNTQKLSYNLQILKERDAENRQTVDQYRKKIQRLQESLSLYTERYRKEDAKFKAENTKLTDEYRRITSKFKDLQKKLRFFEAQDRKKYADVFKMNRDSTVALAEKVIKADRIIHDQILGKEWEEPAAYAFIKNAGARSETQAKAAGESAADGEAKGVYNNAQIRQVMTLMAQECSFLIDAKTQQACEGVTSSEAQLLKADAILSSLGLEDREDLDRLCALFFDTPKDAQPLVHKNDVVRVVKGFIMDKKARVRDKPSAGGGGGRRSVKKDLKFWDKLKQVLPNQKQRTWAALESGLVRYNALLSDRQKQVDETNSLLKTNEELKMLLQEYLNSRVNDEFEIPPTNYLSVSGVGAGGAE